MVITDKNIGEIIKSRRKELGYTQMDVAIHANIHRVHVSRIENNHMSTTLKTFLSICDALELKIKLHDKEIQSYN